MRMRTSIFHRIIRVLGVIALVLSGTSGVVAQSDTLQVRARQLFQSGVILYEDGEYQKALEAFQEAYRLRPHPMVRVNIANCYDRLGSTKEAIFHFEHFLAETEGDTRQRKEVKAALKRLEKRLGKVTLQVFPDGATVMIDRYTQMRAPILDPIPLLAGKHTIRVKYQGYQTAERRFEIIGDQSINISINLEKAKEVSAEPIAVVPKAVPITEPAANEGELPDGNGQEPMKKDIESSSDRPQFEQEGVLPLSVEEFMEAIDEEEESILGGSRILISGSITAVLGISAIICTISALGAEADYDTNYNIAMNDDKPTEDRREAQTRAIDIGRRADNLWIATGVLIGGTVISGALLTYFIVNKMEKRARSVLSIRPYFGSRGGFVTIASGF